MADTPDSFARGEFRDALLRLLRASTVLIQTDPELRDAIAGLAAAVTTAAPVTSGAASGQSPAGSAAGRAEAAAQGAASGAGNAAASAGSPGAVATGSSGLPGTSGTSGTSGTGIAVPRPAAVVGPRLLQEVKIGDARVMIETQGGVVRSLIPQPEPEPFAPAAGPAVQGGAANEPDQSWIGQLPALGPIAARVRLKAQALREASAIRRHALRAEWIALAADEPPTAADELAFDGATPVSAEDADALEAMAVACDLGTLLRERGQLHPGPHLAETFQAMAHAQSAVRSLARRAASEFERQRTDSDQVAFFQWMRTAVAPEHCATFIRDYFRLDHLAPSSDGPEVLRRLRELEARWHARLDAERDARKSRDKVRDKCKNLARKDDAEREVECRLIEENLGRLASLGQNLLAPPIIDYVRNALPHIPAAARTLPHIAQILGALAQPEAEAADELPQAATPDVLRLREELRSRGIRRVVIAGGEFKPLKRDAVLALLGVDDVVWVEVERTKSNSGLDGRVRAAHPDMVLSTRWMSHPDEAKVTEAARELGVPLIRLMSEGALGGGPLTKTILDHFAASEARAK